MKKKPSKGSDASRPTRSFFQCGHFSGGKSISGETEPFVATDSVTRHAICFLMTSEEKPQAFSDEEKTENVIPTTHFQCSYCPVKYGRIDMWQLSACMSRCWEELTWAMLWSWMTTAEGPPKDLGSSPFPVLYSFVVLRMRRCVWQHTDNKRVCLDHRISLGTHPRGLLPSEALTSAGTPVLSKMCGCRR